MSFSRRELLRSIAASALTSAAITSLDEVVLARPPGTTIRLDQNENAYGPSPKAIEAMRACLLAANRYPRSECEELTERIARFHKIKHEQVTLGAGTREILRMAATAYLLARKKLVLASPTFDAMSETAQRAVGANLAKVALTRRSSHDLEAMLAEVDATTGLIYICNPNNPTGSLTPRKDLEVFLSKLPASAVVLIDEAYHDYVGTSSDYVSFIDHPLDDDRLIVTRTFSKMHGLAGLRIGYAVSSPQRSRELSASRLSWDVNVVAAHAAAAALEDSEHVRLCAERNRSDRQEFYNMVNARMMRQIDSLANFVFMNTGIPGAQVVEHFRKNNILLGPLVPQMDKYVRVSLGVPEEMREFWRVWDLLPPHEMAM
jgi:histidinol-phosphate aminotransferase